MLRTLFLLGASDIEEQNPVTNTTVEQGGIRVTAEMAGLLPIMPFILNDRTLRASSAQVLVGVQPIPLPRNARVNVFNVVGDADSSSNMLQRIQHIANELQPRRFFNPPSRVFPTARERLPKTLANIPRCIVPRVASADPRTITELRAACDAFAAWPMIVRARGYHGGKNMVVLAGPAQLEDIKDEPWLYSGGLCLIEYIDYKNREGLYQKTRVIVVDGTPYPRHSIYSDNWMIHAGSRAELMHQDLALCRQEERVLADLSEMHMGGYAEVFREIHARIGLDIYGIDFAMVDGQILVFEANPCMKFLDRHYRADNRYSFLDGHVKELKRAVKKMLLTA
jgi:hypothetical protein